MNELVEWGKRLYVIGGLIVTYGVFLFLILTIPFWRSKPRD